MEKPNKEDDKYWLPMVIDKVKGTKEIPFYHLYYERDLERYIEYLESKVNNGVLDDVMVIKGDDSLPTTELKLFDGDDRIA